MVRVRCAGFPQGDPVAISASSGSVHRSASVPQWGGASDPPEVEETEITLSLTATRTTGTAPAGVIFEAAGTSPAPGVTVPYQDLHYTWDFADAGDFAAVPADIPWGQDRNTAYGPVVSHVFTAPGTYAVTCTARDGLNPPKTETVTLLIADPDTVFSGDSTAVISASSDFTGKPSGAAEFTSFTAAYAATSGKPNQRYLFRAGETFVNPQVAISANCERAFVGAFGNGVAPVFENTGNGVELGGSTSRIETAVSGIDIRMPYDPTNPGGTNPDGLGVSFGSSSWLAGFKTLTGVTIQGARTGIYTWWSETQPGSHIHLSDVSISDWYDYGMFCGDGGYFGLSGTRIAQNGDTINGAGKGVSPYWADHGPFRISRQAGPVCANLCDLKSFNSWAASDGDRSMQPTFRCNTGQTDEKLNLDRIRSEGGPLLTHNATGSATNQPMFALMDKAQIILADHPIYGLVLSRGGTTIRNVIAVVPDTPPGTSTGLRNMAWVGDPGSNFDDNLARRLEIYSCTFVDLRSDANARSRTGSQDRDYARVGGAGFSDVYIGNMIDYAPNMATGGTLPAVTLDTSPRWPVVYGGERWESASPDLTRQYGTEVTADFQPAALVAIDGKCAIDDFYGVLRGDNPCKGAVEPG